MEIIDLELKTLQSGHGFQIQGQMTEDFFFQGQGRKISKICQKFKFSDSEKNVTRDTPSIDSDHLCQIRKESIQNCRCYKADTIF